MFGKDIMKNISDTLNNMSEKEKAKRAKSLKKLMDDELKRRQTEKNKKPKKS